MTLIELSPAVRRSSRSDDLPVAIIGAGPIGLAAAANLLERGIEFQIYESGPTVASSMDSWRHVRLFSPWRHLIDPVSRRLLDDTGWAEPEPGVAPHAAALIDHYLEPLAALEPIRSRIRLRTAVVSVTRQGMDRTRSAGRETVPFELRLSHDDGTQSEVAARAVIDASGTFSTPNSIASNGLPPIGLDTVGDRVVRALPDVLGIERSRFAGRHTAVVGAGHSAANTLIDLAELARDEPGTAITWVIRNRSAARVSDASDELPGRGALGARVRGLVDAGAITVIDRFEVIRVERTDSGVELVGSRPHGVERVRVDQVVNATGFRPDLDMLREIRLDLDEVVEAPRRLAGLIDPNLHSCGTVEPHGFAELSHPEQSFFLAGMKSYGRAPTFLLATGYEQVRSIAAWLAGDMAAATAVSLVLPATGVCSTGPADNSCCEDVSPDEIRL